MSALDLLADLHAAGVKISAVDGQLRLRAPPGDISPALRDRVATHKAELISLLGCYTGPVRRYPQSGESYDAPLSFAQEKLVFLNSYLPGDASYNMAFRCDLTGMLDADILTAALNNLAKRHPALRTSFHQTTAGFIQRIHERITIAIEAVDVSTQGAEQTCALINKLAGQPFDLALSPLVRFHLLQHSCKHHTLVLVAHHIVFDMQSAAICLAELQADYFRLAEGLEPEPEQKNRLSYADYAHWQREQQDKARLDNLLSFWRTELAGAPAALELPGDLPRPPEPSGRGGWIEHPLEQELTRRLATLAVQSSCTPSMIMFSAFAIFLSRITGEHDIVIGLPVDGRGYTELEDVVGFFLNTLAIRCRPEPASSFTKIVSANRDHLVAAYKHQDLPFERLIEALQPERDLSRTPIFQVMYAWHDDDTAAGNKTGRLRLSAPEVVGHNTAKFDLTLVVFRRGEDIRFGFEFNSDIFSVDAAERLFGRFRLLLGDALRQPETAAAQLRLMDDAERGRMVAGFNSTAEVAEPECLHRLVEEQARRTPTATALQDNATSLTYRELNEQANRLAHHLCAQQIGPGDRVGILTDRGRMYPLAMLAILKTGAAYVPLDTAFPLARLEYVIGDASLSLLLTESRLEPDTDTACILLNRFDFAAGDTSDLAATVQPEDAAYVIYTSGSTGKPKGTILSHSGLANLLRWQARQKGLDFPARTLHYASLCFDVTFTEVFSTWASGGTLICIPDNERRDFHSLLKYLEEFRVERLFLPCAALQPIAETLNALPAAKKLSFSDVIVSGEQLNISAAIRELFNSRPELRLHNHYGPAETHVVTACTLPEDASTWPTAISIGKPISNTRIYVLDERNQPLPPGIAGQLCIAGAAVGLGYHARPELTEQKFVPDPFIDDPAAKMYKTGDLARYRPDGSLDFLGRKDQQIKVRGYRVEPGEIEVTLDNFAEIRRAVVAGRIAAHSSAGTQLVAWIELQSGYIFDEESLRGKLAAVVPEYMVPHIFVPIDQMPLTVSGKIDRLALPAPDFRSRQISYSAPETETESFLCDSFGELLRLERIGTCDNFFQLGGQSLLAMQLVARVREHLGLTIPLKYVFRYPTPGQLAATLETLELARRDQPAGSQEQEHYRV
jgi:amino acid adenylation domain-containing protein